jgi:hypothetical protein
MKTARKYLIPAFVAAFALMFAVATPFVMAEYGDGYAKYHKKPWAVQVSNDFVGNIPITEDSTHQSLKDQITITLSEAASKYPDAKKAKLGIAVNDNGKYVVWKVIEMTMDSETNTKSMMIHVIDAGAESIDKAATEDVQKEFDHSTKYTRHGDYKMSGHKMHGYYADMTPEELEAKRAQHKEMKEAFSTLSEEEQTAIKSHFHSMMTDNADMSQEDREAKFAKLKAEMQAFMELSLDEKISYLKYFAQSLKNQE